MLLVIAIIFSFITMYIFPRANFEYCYTLILQVITNLKLVICNRFTCILPINSTYIIYKYQTTLFILINFIMLHLTHLSRGVLMP